MSSSRRRRRTAPDGRDSPVPEAGGRLSYAEKVRILLRESLLDAAADALTEHAWSAVRMADIAAAVGVSRQTVYNEFGSKDELARALLLREADRFLDEIEVALDQHPDDAVAGLTAAVEVFLRTAESEPLLHAILGGSGAGDLGPLLAGQGMSVLPIITERLTEHFLGHTPSARADQVRAYTDAAVRLAISHVVLPAADPAASAPGVAQVLAPYLLALSNA